MYSAANCESLPLVTCTSAVISAMSQTACASRKTRVVVTRYISTAMSEIPVTANASMAAACTRPTAVAVCATASCGSTTISDTDTTVRIAYTHSSARRGSRMARMRAIGVSACAVVRFGFGMSVDNVQPPSAAQGVPS